MKDQRSNTSPTLFLPGPTQVDEEVRQACSRPMVGHRSPEYSEVHREVISDLKSLLRTEQNVYLSTSSATGVMEAAVRNLVDDALLCCICGAFSERWSNIAERNGKDVHRWSTPWGTPTRAGKLREKLEAGNYQAVTVVHNETSTGLKNNLPGIAEVMSDFPDVLFLVDATSSMGGVDIRVDDWGIDLVLASVQKAFAVPPGLSLFAVSDRALEHSRSVSDQGFYFDFKRFERYQQKDQTISTGPIPQIYALRKQMKRISQEGLENRFERHERMAERCRSWGKERGFDVFPEDNFESPTVTCLENERGIDVEDFRARLKDRGFIISNGYGKISNKTFRIGHMGDHTMKTLNDLLDTMDQLL